MKLGHPCTKGHVAQCRGRVGWRRAIRDRSDLRWTPGCFGCIGGENRSEWAKSLIERYAHGCS